MFVIGIIVGILLSILAFLAGKKLEITINSKDSLEFPPFTKPFEAQFLEPVTEKEKWEGAKTVDDLLDNELK